jgi:hypothetical protein
MLRIFCVYIILPNRVSSKSTPSLLFTADKNKSHMTFDGALQFPTQVMEHIISGESNKLLSWQSAGD